MGSASTDNCIKAPWVRFLVLEDEGTLTSFTKHLSQSNFGLKSAFEMMWNNQSTFSQVTRGIIFYFNLTSKSFHFSMTECQEL